jgi:hypothetical protein
MCSKHGQSPTPDPNALLDLIAGYQVPNETKWIAHNER